MRIEGWDTVFIRARRADVHPVLRDVPGYGRWWPGIAATAAGSRVRLTLRSPDTLGRLLGRSHAAVVEVRKDRLNLGLDLVYRGDLGGDLDGHAEFYYLDEPAGVVVHYLVRADTPQRGWRQRLADHRAVMRAGLNHLKDRLEGARVVGSEPDRALLRDQQDAIAEFQAGVEAYARRVAALRGEVSDAATPATAPEGRGR